MSNFERLHDENCSDCDRLEEYYEWEEKLKLQKETNPKITQEGYVKKKSD